MLDTNTPTLHVCDPRALTVRQISCHRSAVDGAVELRITTRHHDPVGRLIEQWDPRLFDRQQSGQASAPNLTHINSLSGAVLATVGVDAGWRVQLLGESGQRLERWDSQGTRWRCEHDQMLRPRTLHEQAAGQPGRVSERFSYAPPSSEAVDRNSCGRLVRHDDDAGSMNYREFALNGQPLVESRRFLALLDLPDWPEPYPLRDALLEDAPGASTKRYISALGEAFKSVDAAGHCQRYNLHVSGLLQSAYLRLASGEEHCLVRNLSYNAFANVEQHCAGNGVVCLSHYHPADNRLLHLMSKRADGSVLQHLSYGYDPVGNVTQIEDHTQPIRYFANQRIDPLSRYRYDSLYQLIEAHGQEAQDATVHPQHPSMRRLSGDGNQRLNYARHYQYDSAGNLLELRHVGRQSYTRRMQVASLSNRARLITEDGQAAPVDDSFDANGNLLALPSGRPLQWTPTNQLRAVVSISRDNAGNDDEQYIYDGNNLRVRKIGIRHARRSQRREVRYLPGLELRSDSLNDEQLQVISVQTGALSVRCLHWVSGKPDGIDNDQLRYSLDDHLGSSTLELDGQARILSNEGYYPFGETAWWAAANEVEASYKFTRYSGKELDASGLYYYGFRYYAGGMQRWLNPDPSGDGDGLNLFTMVHNNPLTLIDTMGANSQVPQRANWIWMGKPLPQEAVANINAFVRDNPGYQATLWVDRQVSGGAHRPLAQLSSRVQVSRIEGLFAGLGAGLQSAFERERSGPLKNYPAASDIARTGLMAQGGIYMDTDVRLRHPLPTPLHAPEGILIGPHHEGFGNAIIAAPMGSGVISDAMARITSRYHSATKGTWDKKRAFPDARERGVQERLRGDELSKVDSHLLSVKAEYDKYGNYVPASLIQRNSSLMDAREQVSTGPGEVFLPPERVVATIKSTGPLMWQTLLNDNNIVNHRFAQDQFHPVPADGFAIYRKPDGFRRASI